MKIAQPRSASHPRPLRRALPRAHPSGSPPLQPFTFSLQPFRRNSREYRLFGAVLSDNYAQRPPLRPLTDSPLATRPALVSNLKFEISNALRPSPLAPRPDDLSFIRKDPSFIPEYPPLSRNIPPYPRISPPPIFVRNQFHISRIHDAALTPAKNTHLDYQRLPEIVEIVAVT